jgi:hypothetical protein
MVHLFRHVVVVALEVVTAAFDPDVGDRTGNLLRVPFELGR